MLSVAPPAKVEARRGAGAEAKISVYLQPGYHVNSNTPSEEYLIPLRLTWMAGPLQPAGVIYPKPRMEKYEFSPTPLSVFTGNFELVSKFKVAAGAAAGPGVLSGRLRYQACNNKACFPPKSVEIKLPYLIR
ncbi:MAG: hypothetical protein M1436_00700 [Acidobacteria bacterium]|nr:hypothetical protein [Acidobacteriota bacterium]